MNYQNVIIGLLTIAQTHLQASSHEACQHELIAFMHQKNLQSAKVQELHEALKIIQGQFNKLQYVQLIKRHTATHHMLPVGAPVPLVRSIVPSDTPSSPFNETDLDHEQMLIRENHEFEEHQAFFILINKFYTQTKKLFIDEQKKLYNIKEKIESIEYTQKVYLFYLENEHFLHQIQENGLITELATWPNIAL